MGVEVGVSRGEEGRKIRDGNGDGEVGERGGG